MLACKYNKYFFDFINKEIVFKNKTFLSFFLLKIKALLLNKILGTENSTLKFQKNIEILITHSIMSNNLFFIKKFSEIYEINNLKNKNINLIITKQSAHLEKKDIVEVYFKKINDIKQIKYLLHLATTEGLVSLYFTILHNSEIKKEHLKYNIKNYLLIANAHKQNKQEELNLLFKNKKATNYMKSMNEELFDEINKKMIQNKISLFD